MGRVTKVDLSLLTVEFDKAVDIPVSPQNQSIWLEFSSDAEVRVYFVTKDGLTVPMYVGTFLDQTYDVTGEVVGIVLQPNTKKQTIAWSISTARSRRRGEVVDPTPKRVPVPIDNNSMEVRVMRMVDAALASRGYTAPSRGHSYGGDDIDDDDVSDLDTEFGPGYTVDPALVTELDDGLRELADRQKKKKEAPGPKDAAEVPEPNPSVPDPAAPSGGSSK